MAEHVGSVVGHGSVSPVRRSRVLRVFRLQGGVLISPNFGRSNICFV